MIAGLVSTVVFAVVHQVLILSIWFSILPMLIAGALCGGCLGTTYAVVADPLTLRGWLAYNALFVALFFLLALASELVFDPIVTAAQVMAGGGPPGELFGRSLPFMGFFTVASTLALTAVYGAGVGKAAALFVTVLLLMALLGMNVGIIGLVEIPSAFLPLLGLMFALILVLAAVNAAVFALLERKILAA